MGYGVKEFVVRLGEAFENEFLENSTTFDLFKGVLECPSVESFLEVN